MGRSSSRKRDRRKVPEPTGNCYDSAVEQAVDLWLMLKKKYPEAIKTLFVCHGTATGQGPIAGVAIGHAWVEYGGIVLDRSNGGDYTMLRENYYRLGEIRDVHRYSMRETFINLNRHGHYGPWHE